MTGTSTATDWLLDERLAPDVATDPLAPLYDGGARGELVLPFCGSCDLPLDLEQPVCDACGSFECVWKEVVPTGVVHSSTTMHRREPGLVLADGPYPIVDVELTSGHRLIMTTFDPATSPPEIGIQVGITFRILGGVAIPAAKPIASPETEATV
ncbi:OB-fold domain-containing protein [Rhodococcus oxybenzonivorans]|uniref:Zn-ribbon domain-containing OB-fold protein n=1 Tax=Rhodococcus oxybenzonivorans TaxID=1990687 RepID=UPI002954DC33|nr:OB-fold domain-containing protein [Rhodococcus oxybenzonivorans]MDV7352726.1 OB-fold domain-containing protein [Rhodococcus oxybenzonivorans]